MAKFLRHTAGTAAHSQPHDDVTLLCKVPFDVYRGSASALIARGIVSLDQFPGQSGMTKTMVSFNADGSVRVRGGSHKGWQIAGAKRIRRLAGDRFEVRVTVSSDERERRREQVESSSAERLAGQLALKAISAAARSSIMALSAKTHVRQSRQPLLRLVWSSAESGIARRAAGSC